MKNVKENSTEEEMSESIPRGAHLDLGVNDIPSLPRTLLLAFQQSMLCFSGLLIFPFLVSEIACAGSETINLRVTLIAATFVACGVATFLQSTFGLRLAVLHGSSLAFLPPLMAYSKLPENICNATMDTHVPVEEWHGRLQTISGSLLLACCLFIIVGSTGLVGFFARHVGPLTIVPLLTLLSLSTVDTIESKISLHWVGIFELCALIAFTVFLENVRVPFPVFSFKTKRFSIVRTPIFCQFPYLLAMTSSWLICFTLTMVGSLSADSPARTDSPTTRQVISGAAWVSVPYPGQLGGFRLSAGLCLGYVASCMSSVIENVGSYKMAAIVSQQGNPPKHSVNRAIIVEGLGSMLAASLGVSAGVTTFSENIALIHITKVASRVTMQVAGVVLVCLGLFTKMAAIFATLPEPLVGGILCIGMSMIAGVALSNLRTVNLSLTRNLAILGLAVMLGTVIPHHFAKHPVNTGNDTWDQVINMLLSIQMLIGGVIAFVLDNTAGGATRADRGFPSDDENQLPLDGFNLPILVDRFLDAVPILRRLPFLPPTSPRNGDSELPITDFFEQKSPHISE